MIWPPKWKNTALRGRTVMIEMTEDAYEALMAAITVAFEDPDSIPAEYADGANEWWGFIRLPEPTKGGRR